MAIFHKQISKHAWRPKNCLCENGEILAKEKQKKQQLHMPLLNTIVGLLCALANVYVLLAMRLAIFNIYFCLTAT